MRVGKVAKNITRLLLAVTIGLALVGFLPATAQADTNPVDLELGGEGATPWSMSDIEPGHSGTKTVELHNVGSKDGFVTIWLDDIISSEGSNPESETGDTAEPGEFDDHLLLNLSVDGLSTNLNLPTTINDLPHSASDSHYIEVVPLKSGDTVNLQWEWELPAQTGNEVQGDNISFTINYLLRECTITDVSDVVTEEGVFTEAVTTESEGGRGKLTIEKDTVGKTEQGESLSEIWIIEIDKELPAPPEGTVTAGVIYDAGPHGATFDPPITITVSYDMPPWVSEATLVIVLWDENAGEWVPLAGCTVDTVNDTISAPVFHFSRYTVIAPILEPVYEGGGPPAPTDEEEEPPAPTDEEEEPPAPTDEEEEPPAPTDEEEEPPAPTDEEEEPPTTGALLEINMLEQESSIEIGADGILREALRLTDRNGNFVIDIDSGTKMTGVGNVELSRIELRITDESIVVPDDVVVLSPIYKLTGYTHSMEVTRINFEPPARLTISYDPQDLPENAFLPFIINYTDEQGLVRLEPPPGSVVEIGKAKAEISNASLFAVVVELAPPPPPLPARFEASNLTINPQQAQLGQTVTISLTIANEGATEGSFELHLIIDGIVRMVREITLGGKSSETLTFEVSNLAVGSHHVKIAGLTEQFRIVMTATPAGEERGVNWLVIDVSVGAGLIMGALVLYFITRRSRQVRPK